VKEIDVKVLGASRALLSRENFFMVSDPALLFALACSSRAMGADLISHRMAGGLLRTRRAAVMNKHSNAVGEQCYESDYIDGNQNLPRPYPLHKGRSILKEGGFGFH